MATTAERDDVFRLNKFRGESHMAIQKKSLISNLNSTKKTETTAKPAAGISASEAPTASRAVLSKKIANRAIHLSKTVVASSARVSFSKKAAL
jgi:hypothetical protein